MPAGITVRLKDGKSYSHQVDAYPGFPTHPFSWADTEVKFARLAGERADAGLHKEIETAVRSLESIEVAELMRLLGQFGLAEGPRREDVEMPVTRSDSAPPLSIADVQEIFRNLESGDGKKFFDHVAEDVDWIVEGTHPLAGHYRSKPDFLTHTFEKLAKVLPRGTQLWVEHALVSGDWRWWSCKLIHREEWPQVRQPVLLGVSFVNGTIEEVRAYLDSALVAQLFAEDPI